MKSIHTAVREQFSQHADYYAQSSAHAKGDTLDVILDFAEPKGTERTLDVATGTGFTAFALAPKVGYVVATDLTPEMVAKAAELAAEQAIDNITFSVAAAESLPFATASLDLVTCRLAPHHFQDVPKFLSEVHRVLRTDGLFCLADSVSTESESQTEYPPNINTGPLQAFFNNLDNLPEDRRAAAALAIDTAIRNTKQDDWRDNRTKKMQVRNAIARVIDEAFSDEGLDPDTLLELAVSQSEY